MAARPSVQHIVVNTNECQFWQMLATMWMGHYWELSSSICPDMWWPRLQSNDWQSNQHNGEHPSCLGLHEPQADDKQTGAGTTPNFVVAGCDATEPDGCEELSGPHEPMIQTHKDENIPVTPAPRTDDFDEYLLEHSMQHFAAMACDADLQVDWNTNGAGTINLVDMTTDAVATASTCVPVTKLGGSIGQCCSNLAKPVGVDTSAFSSAMGIYGNRFLENQADMLNANSDAGLPRALAEFELGDRVITQKDLSLDIIEQLKRDIPSPALANACLQKARERFTVHGGPGHGQATPPGRHLWHMDSFVKVLKQIVNKERGRGRGAASQQVTSEGNHGGWLVAELAKYKEELPAELKHELLEAKEKLPDQLVDVLGTFGEARLTETYIGVDYAGGPGHRWEPHGSASWWSAAWQLKLNRATKESDNMVTW
eukprot:Skav227877  [mRNA]  locus=scaffold2896:258598:267919:+ [translate_table: standard]